MSNRRSENPEGLSLKNRVAYAGTDAADSANCRIPSRFDGGCSRKSEK